MRALTRVIFICLLFTLIGARAGLAAAQERSRAFDFAFSRPELFSRYEDYAEKNPNLAERAIVVHVNIGLDRPFYNGVAPVATADGVLALCNKYHRLDEAYVPGDLISAGAGMRLRQAAAAAFENMRRVMEEDGLRVTARSAYRSFENQDWIYRQSVTRNGMDATEAVVARAGHSEHQLGLAVDILQAGYYGATLAGADFAHTEQYAWLTRNAHEYGFVLRYPENGRSVTGFAFEPWHWRYVGAEAALFMRDNNIETFDEYCAVMPEGSKSAHTPP